MSIAANDGYSVVIRNPAAPPALFPPTVGHSRGVFTFLHVFARWGLPLFRQPLPRIVCSCAGTTFGVKFIQIILLTNTIIHLNRSSSPLRTHQAARIRYHYRLVVSTVALTPFLFDLVRLCTIHVIMPALLNFKADDGSVTCTGGNSQFGECAGGDTTLYSTTLQGPPSYKDVCCSELACTGLDTAGNIWVWGADHIIWVFYPQLV
jgi:hypothetical protein